METAAPSVCALNTDCSPVGLYNLLADQQTETRTLLAARRQSAGTLESAKQKWQFFVTNSLPLIAD
jgi:hypothetical protein